MRSQALRAGQRRDRLVGAVALAVGVALALLVQAVAPVGVPLYDGVAVEEPYRYLHPTGDQPGDPASFSATLPVTDGISPILIAATSEAPPQAQLVAQPDAFELTPGATSLQVSITPVEAPDLPPDDPIAGNVYRFSVTDQAGTPLQIKRCEGCITLSMRGPETLEQGRLERYTGHEWQFVDAIHVPTTGTYQLNVTELGDFAVIGGEVARVGLDPIFLVGGGAVVLLLLVAAWLAFRVRSPTDAADAGTASGRSAAATPGPRTVPSKRKRPPGPPSGRADR